MEYDPLFAVEKSLADGCHPEDFKSAGFA